MNSGIILIGAFIALVVILVNQLHKANRESDFKKQMSEFSRLVRVVERWVGEHPHHCLPHPTVQEEVNCAYAYAWWLKLHYPEMIDCDRKINRVLRDYAEHVGPLQKAHD